jgi:hypothetical protein
MTKRWFISRVCNCCIIMNVISTGCIRCQICSASCTVANGCCIVYVTVRSATMQMYCCKYKLYYQFHWLPVEVVLLPVVSLPGVSKTSYTAIPVPLPAAKLPVELLLLPPTAHSSNCTASEQKVTLLPSVFASSCTVRVT